jgi:hypothetical protein
MTTLPDPDSSELKKIVPSSMSRDIYRILYANRKNPLSIAVMRRLLVLQTEEQGHFDRRLRDLYPYFEIVRTKKGKDSLYELVSAYDKPRQIAGKISKADRAWVLRDRRCVQCGRTPAEDRVRLHVDHMIPQDWGGTSERENLQALCSECNEGKKNLFSSYNEFTDKIKQAINYEEPHKRIGELLKAFNGKEIPSEVLELVAKSKQYQADWQKRLRELRELEWQYSVKRRKENGRIRTFYKLIKFEPWPEGKVAAEIKKREQQKD